MAPVPCSPQPLDGNVILQPYGLAEELGYDGPPTTPEEFKEMACKAAATPFSKATGEGSLGYQLRIDTSRFASWTFAFGGDIYDYTANQFTLNSDAAVAAMTLLAGLVRRRLRPSSYQRTTAIRLILAMAPCYSPLVQALVYHSTSQLLKRAGHEWSVAPLPSVTGTPKQNVYGASVGIPKSTPERELAAWLFLKFYTRPDIQAQWAKFSLYFPTRASVADEMEAFSLANPTYKKAFDLLEYGVFEPPVPGYDFVRQEVNVYMAAIVDDPSLDVATELGLLNVTANELLAEQLAQIQN